jgi:hypothetical protein
VDRAGCSLRGDELLAIDRGRTAKDVTKVTRIDARLRDSTMLRRHTASSGIADAKKHFEGRPRCRYCQIGTGNFSAPPAVICKLSRAIAGNTDAHRYRYDTILIAAVETIETFERAEERNYLHAGVTNF